MKLYSYFEDDISENSEGNLLYAEEVFEFLKKGGTFEEFCNVYDKRFKHFGLILDRKIATECYAIIGNPEIQKIEFKDGTYATQEGVGQNNKFHFFKEGLMAALEEYLNG